MEATKNKSGYQKIIEQITGIFLPIIGCLTAASIIKSEILDVKSGNSYKTIQFGPYTWMAENANYKVSKSSCYDGDYENCESNGRLYQSMNADQACPSGFKIPSEADYEYMLKFAKSVTDPALGFNPQMSGSCETVNGELQCKGQGKESYLMTSDFDVFKVTSKGKAYFDYVLGSVSDASELTAIEKLITEIIEED